jgi:hypothetical protein
MSQDSLLKAVRLGRKQLLDTKCWVDPLAKGSIDIEISHTVEISAHDKSKGSSYDLHVLTKTELVGRAEDKSEAVRVSFSFRYGYDVVPESVSPEQMKERKQEFGKLLYPSDRVYLSHQLLEMGVNPSFLPYSIEEEDGETPEGGGEKKGGKHAAKRKHGHKEK